MFTIPARLLEYNTGEYEGNKYSNILARVDDKILKFKLDSKIVLDQSKNIDKNVVLTFIVAKGKDSNASIKVTDVSVK